MSFIVKCAHTDKEVGLTAMDSYARGNALYRMLGVYPGKRINRSELTIVRKGKLTGEKIAGS